ncbi:MAG TPA: phosphate butyryltransferase, partial [Phycisphaerae bacterium]|nr:phosphate butyryltransferase [Phycisphaerae bacterium]
CLVQGPLAVDNAVSPEAAETKGIPGPVAGHADVLLVSSVEVGNIFAKGIVYFSSCPVGGVVGGTSRSVTLLSRSDTTATKLNTLALGVLMSEP